MKTNTNQIEDGPTDIALVTGGDRNVFLNLLALMESVRRHLPDRRLLICDYGLTREQAAFFDSLGVRIPKPDSLAPYRHPWHLKAGTVDYLTARDFDGFLWTDADTLFVCDSEDEITNILKRMTEAGLAVAATHAAGLIGGRLREIAAALDLSDKAGPGIPYMDGLSLSEFSDLAQRKGLNVSHYEELLNQYNVSRDLPMISIGFLLCLDLDFARRWRDLSLSQEVWICFEQICFNALIYSEDLPRLILDLTEWNVHGPLLETVLTPRAGTEARHLHIGSIGAQTISGPIRVGAHEKEIAGDLKVFTRPDLHALFFQYLEAALDRYHEALVDCGVLVNGE